MLQARAIRFWFRRAPTTRTSTSLGKAITVTSTSGPTGGAAHTTIDGHAVAGVAAATFQSGELRASVLNGFTLTGGGHSAGGNSKPGGVYVNNSAPTITNNIITANTCYGIQVNAGAALIQGNELNSTTNGSTSACTYSGAGVYLQGSVTGNLGGFQLHDAPQQLHRQQHPGLLLAA